MIKVKKSKIRATDPYQGYPATVKIHTESVLSAKDKEIKGASASRKLCPPDHEVTGCTISTSHDLIP
jgi:SET domain-containing protein